MAVGLLSVLGLTGCSAPTPPGPTHPDRPASYVEYDSLFADWAPRYVECARKYGADAELLPSGSIANAYADGREVKEGLDAACMAEVGSPPDVPAATKAFFMGMYELFIEQADCLRKNGYAISDPPSREHWVETYDGASWDPLMEVNDAGRDVQTADKLCPQPEPREAERIGNTLAADGAP